MKIAFAFRDPHLRDKWTGPVLGLYTYLVRCSRMIRFRTERGSNKRPYIKQGSFLNEEILPKIACRGTIFVTHVGLFFASRHIHLMNVSLFVDRVLLLGIIFHILKVGTSILLRILVIVAMGLGNLVNLGIGFPTTATTGRGCSSGAGPFAIPSGEGRRGVRPSLGLRSLGISFLTVSGCYLHDFYHHHRTGYISPTGPVRGHLMTSTMYISSNTVSHSASGGRRTCGCHHGFCLHLLLHAVHSTGNMCTHMRNVSIKFERFSRIYAFAMSPQTKATCTVRVVHFWGHRGIVVSQKRATSFRRQLDFNFLALFKYCYHPNSMKEFFSSQNGHLCSHIHGISAPYSKVPYCSFAKGKMGGGGVTVTKGEP